MESYHGEDDEAPAAANVQPPHPAAATGATAAVEEVVVEEAPDEGRIGELTESAAAEKEGAPGTSSAGRSPVDSPRTSADISGKAKVADMSAVAAGVAGAGAAVVAAKKAEEAKRENTITKEKRAEGAISAKTYITYVKNMGTPALLFALFLMALFERLLSVFTNVWLALWSEKHWDGLSQGDYLAGYAGIGIGQAAVSWARTFAWALASLAAANALHLALFKATLNTRLSFFDTTPLGRVIQRFTKDTATLDNTLGQSVSSLEVLLPAPPGHACGDGVGHARTAAVLDPHRRVVLLRPALLPPGVS